MESAVQKAQLGAKVSKPIITVLEITYLGAKVSKPMVSSPFAPSPYIHEDQSLLVSMESSGIGWKVDDHVMEPDRMEWNRMEWSRME